MKHSPSPRQLIARQQAADVRALTRVQIVEALRDGRRQRSTTTNPNQRAAKRRSGARGRTYRGDS